MAVAWHRLKNVNELVCLGKSTENPWALPIPWAHTQTQIFAVDKHKHIERFPKNRSVNLYYFQYFIDFFISFSFVIPLHTNIYIHTDWLHIRWKWVQPATCCSIFGATRQDQKHHRYHYRSTFVCTFARYIMVYLYIQLHGSIHTTHL